MGFCRHNVRVPPFFFSASQLRPLSFHNRSSTGGPLKILKKKSCWEGLAGGRVSGQVGGLPSL